MYTITDLYDLSHTLAGEYLSCFTYPWEALSGLADCIRALGASLDSDYLPFAPEGWVHKTAHVAPTASITGPSSPSWVCVSKLKQGDVRPRITLLSHSAPCAD